MEEPSKTTRRLDRIEGSPTRTAILIDSGYLLHVLRDELDGARVRLEKLFGLLGNGKQVIERRYYTCLPYLSSPPTRDQRASWSRTHVWMTSIHEGGIKIRLGQLVARGRFGSGVPKLVEKQTDVLLATDIAELVLTGAVDQIVLVTGDSDLLPAIRLAQRYGVPVRLVYGRDSVSHQLLADCDEHRELDLEMLRPALKPVSVPLSAVG
jgi:uncharacterized LabA/DUF88 family protein